MKRKPSIFLPLVALLTLLSLAACKETEEAGEYDNWRARNDLFIDSLYALAGDNYLMWNDPAPPVETRVTTQVPRMNVGELYAILVQDAATTNGQRYTYAKKLVDNPQGRRLLYTDSFSAYYHGTYINGTTFDGNFDGYAAADDREGYIPFMRPQDMRWYTDFDEPCDMNVSTDSRIPSGLRWVLQFAREGERWLVYVPYDVGYGESSYTYSYTQNGTSLASVTVLAGSTLIYDIVLNSIE